MRIVDHKAEGVSYLPAHFIGAEITPEIVILHDTAGALTKGSSSAYLASDNSGEVSVHFVVEIDGTITQLVPTNLRANHAGASSYHGREWCNGFSIGIEIVNPGKMTAIPGRPHAGRAWYGTIFEDPDAIMAMETPEHGAGVWMAYSEAQMEALVELLQALFLDIPTLTDITTHWYVSPGRKVDTNPLFPLEHIRARILGRDDPADQAAEAVSIEVTTGEMVQIDTESDTLNLRRWPSFNPNVIATIPHGAVVPVLREGLFAGRHWLRVLYGGHEGWIVASYAAPITFQSEAI